MKIPLTKPYLPKHTFERIVSVLDSMMLTEGAVTQQLEDMFAAFTGATYAIATTSCTTGLELALRALGIQKGDEVIVPDYTYPATAQSVMLTGATAVVVDCDPHTLNVDYDAMEAAITKQTRVLMPVSLFGNPLDWDRLEAMASQYDLFIIEDAACGLGSSYDGRPTGSFGQAAVFSLHPRKSITTGEGGMITTTDSYLAQQFRSCKRFGLETTGNRESTQFVRLGTNSKMSDIVAAVGVAQMVEADSIFAQRRKIAHIYDTLLAEAEQLGKLRKPLCIPKGIHGWQSYCICIQDRDRILTHLRNEGIEAQIGTYTLHQEPLFQTHPLCRLEGEMSGSLTAYNETLTLPLFHTLTETEQHYIVEKLYTQLV